jgi:creatinine amidohydrolase
VAAAEPRHLAHLSPPDVRGYLARDDRVIIPFGAIENNGPHLPLVSDTVAAQAVADAASSSTGVVVAPAIPWGASAVNMGFPGTITLEPRVLERIVEGVCLSLAFHGFRRFAIVSGHYENVWPAASAAETLRDRGLLVAQLDLWRLVKKLCRDLAVTDQMPFGHGGEVTTSVILASAPELVARDRMEAEIPPDGYGLKYYRTYPEVMGFAAWDEVSRSGSVGDPTAASADAGGEVIGRVAETLAELLADMREADLPPPREFS